MRAGAWQKSQISPYMCHPSLSPPIATYTFFSRRCYTQPLSHMCHALCICGYFAFSQGGGGAPQLRRLRSVRRLTPPPPTITRPTALPQTASTAAAAASTAAAATAATVPAAIPALTAPPPAKPPPIAARCAAAPTHPICPSPTPPPPFPTTLSLTGSLAAPSLPPALFTAAAALAATPAFAAAAALKRCAREAYDRLELCRGVSSDEGHRWEGRPDEVPPNRSQAAFLLFYPRPHSRHAFPPTPILALHPTCPATSRPTTDPTTPLHLPLHPPSPLP